VVVIVKGTATFRLNGAVVTTDLVSFTATVKLLVPVKVGVPEITPVLGASVNPVGRAPEKIDHV
jgi:hypothetical protein